MSRESDQRNSRPDDESLDAGDDAVSLEELSQSYANLIGKNAVLGNNANSNLDIHAHVEDSVAKLALDATREPTAGEPDVPITPTSILEAILLVGRPDNGPITAADVAGLMRGVESSEIEQMVGELNASYVATSSGLRIASIGGGYRMHVDDELKSLVDRFYGRAREIKLNQAAIDCLALIAYQPGISRAELDRQRDQASGPVLNQLVRRQLVEIRRDSKGQRETHYYPTDRILKLAGLSSLEDLPKVEDWE
jgi:segregation and condensation protein B